MRAPEIKPYDLAGDPQIAAAVDRAISALANGAALVAVIGSEGILAVARPAVAQAIGGGARYIVKHFVTSKEGEQRKRAQSAERIRAQCQDHLAQWRHDAVVEQRAECDQITEFAVVRIEELRERVEQYSVWVARLRATASPLHDHVAEGAGEEPR